MTNYEQPTQITVRKKGNIRKIPYDIGKNDQPNIIMPYVAPGQKPLLLPSLDNGSQKLTTSHEDRTNAYVRRMRPLTILGGAAVGTTIVSQSSVPFLSLAFAAVVLCTSLVFLIVGEIIYQLVSPDGTNLFFLWLHHRRLMDEQKMLWANAGGNERSQRNQRTLIAIVIIIALFCIIALVVITIAEAMWR